MVSSGLCISFSSDIRRGLMSGALFILLPRPAASCGSAGLVQLLLCLSVHHEEYCRSRLLNLMITYEIALHVMSGGANLTAGVLNGSKDLS